MRHSDDLSCGYFLKINNSADDGCCIACQNCDQDWDNCQEFAEQDGTLLFIAITKGKAPAYLGSSFAFLAPASIVIQNFGYEYALGGFVAVGFCDQDWDNCQEFAEQDGTENSYA